ncbi:MAG TPA: alkaline phosphatase family protein [Spirochaetia bacterium]|nr:alkaline phosphatase family protein [Spirochaetia bacterium]
MSPPTLFSHIVVVIEENHSFGDIIGSSDAPYINQIASSGALFSNAYGIEHPSEPNYLDLFSGGNQGVTDDSCPHTFTGSNLALSLIQAGKSFAGYSEDLPYSGYTGCASGTYRRKHNPWVNFANLPDTVNLPMSAFPSDYSQLPSVSFVIPGLETDMHDGTIGAADAWLRAHFSGYLDWAMKNNSLLIVTWDESEGSAGNHIPLIIAGSHVKPGVYDERVDHYSLLRTIEDIELVAPIGASVAARPITGVWK